MKRCTVFHTGLFQSNEGLIVNGLVYIRDGNGKLHFPDKYFMARECEGRLIQFEVEGKWGYADVHTGEVKIMPVWDYVGPIYDGFGHVSLGTQVNRVEGEIVNFIGGKHGYINFFGEIHIPLIYDDAAEIPCHNCFIVAVNKKWGLVNSQNETLIPFRWDLMDCSFETNSILCAMETKTTTTFRSGDSLFGRRLEWNNNESIEVQLPNYEWSVFNQVGNLLEGESYGHLDDPTNRSSTTNTLSVINGTKVNIFPK